MHDQHYICISVFYIGTVCGDRVVRNGNKLTEKLEKLNEVYSQVIASSNLLTKVGCSTSYFSSRRNLVMRVYLTLIFLFDLTVL